MAQSSPASTSAHLPDIPECTVMRTDDGQLHLTHESGRTAIAHTDRGAMLVGMALRILAAYAKPQPPGLRPIQWVHDREDTFRTGDLA